MSRVELNRIPLQVIIDHYRRLKRVTRTPVTTRLLKEIEDYLWEHHRL